MTILCCRFSTEIITAEVLTLLGLYSFFFFLLLFILLFASTVARLKVFSLIPGGQFGGNLTGSDH